MTMAETPATTADPTRPRRRRSTTTDLALIAGFAALISACAYIGGIPVGGAGVPITLQTFGVMLAGCVLGPVRGFLAVALYLLLGAIGLPVFAEHTSGLGVFTGAERRLPVSFPFAAALAGFLVKYVAGSGAPAPSSSSSARSPPASWSSTRCGIAGMKLYFDVSWHDAFNYDTPFWVGDILKTALVALVAAEVHRAFPRLLRIDADPCPRSSSTPPAVTRPGPRRRPGHPRADDARAHRAPDRRHRRQRLRQVDAGPADQRPGRAHAPGGCWSTGSTSRATAPPYAGGSGSASPTRPRSW